MLIASSILCLVFCVFVKKMVDARRVLLNCALSQLLNLFLRGKHSLLFLFIDIRNG